MAQTQVVNASAMGGFYGTGPGTRNTWVGITIPAGHYIKRIGIQSRVGTNGYGQGVYSRIYDPAQQLLVQGGPQNAGPNPYGGVQDPGLSGIYGYWTAPAGTYVTSWTQLLMEVYTPDGSGWAGFGEVVQATLEYEPLPGLTMLI